MDVQETLKRAIALHRAGKLGPAEGLYRKVLKHRPRHTETLQHLGALLEQRGDLIPAAQLLRSAHEQAPKSVDVAITLAVVLNAQKRFADALAVLEETRAQAGDGARLLDRIGDTLVLARRFEDAEAVFADALRRDPADAHAHVGLGDCRRQQGRLVEATRHYSTASALAPDDPRGPLMLQSLLRTAAANWHFRMMHDAARNTLYDEAIRANVRPGDVVLDIGCGAGLLSMMAARAGAGRVYGCDGERLVYEAARQIIARNGFSDRIELFNTRSTDLRVGGQLPQRADVLVFEVFDVSVFGEDVLRTVQHARRELLKPDARLIPAAVRVIAQPVQSPSMRQRFEVGEIAGFDVSPFNLLADRRVFQLELRGETYEPLAAPFTALEVRFDADVALTGGQPADVPITADGALDGFVFWYELVLDARRVLSTSPDAPGTHWRQGFLPQWTPLPVRAGETLPVRAEYRRQMVWFELGRGDRPLTAP